MKTTIEIPDALFGRAKATGAERSQTLKEFVTETLQDKLAARPRRSRPREPEWMRGFGKLRRMRTESARIQARITAAFEQIEPEDRA